MSDPRDRTKRWKSVSLPALPNQSADASASSSGEHVLTLDAIDVYAGQLAASGVSLAPPAQVYYDRLLNHACRKCPHLALIHPPAPFGTPPGALPTMPWPACLVAPVCRTNPDGTITRQHRETWERCPLYGVKSVIELLQSLESRLAATEKRLADLEAR